MDRQQTIQAFSRIYGVGLTEATHYYDAGLTSYQALWQSDQLTPAQRLGLRWLKSLETPVPRAAITEFGRQLAQDVPDLTLVLVGSYRRGAATSAKIKLLVEDHPDVPAVLPHLEGSYLPRPDGYCVILDTPRTVLRVYETAPQDWILTLFRTTGPSALVEAVLAKIEPPLIQPLTQESQIFEMAGLRYLEPAERQLANLEMEFRPVYDLAYSLTELICGRLSQADAACNPISGRISAALIRVAATRIFSDPYQSFLELPVNSIDSWRRLHNLPSIGKFGLGFYSIFYWLIGHPEVKLQIVSRTRTEFWLAAIYELDGQLVIEFRSPTGPEAWVFQTSALKDPRNPRSRYTKRVRAPELYPPGTTGTLVWIEGLPSGIANRINRQLHRLDLITQPRLQIGDVDLAGMVAVASPGLVQIEATGRIFLNYDREEGISMQTLSDSLLIPSSTKTIQSSYAAADSAEMEVRIMPPDSHQGLVIAVGSVIVVEVGSGSNQPYYLINLPLKTPLPVSRDDILLTPTTTSLLAAAFKQLALDTITQGYNLETYFRQLRAYAEYSGQSQIAALIQQTRQVVLDLPDLILVPSERVVTLLQRLGLAAAYLANIDLLRSRQQLEAALGPETHPIFQNVRVVQLPGPLVATDAGLPGYLFVGDGVTDAARLIDSYPGAILRPVGDPQAQVDLKTIFNSAWWLKPPTDIILNPRIFCGVNTNCDYVRGGKFPILIADTIPTEPTPIYMPSLNWIWFQQTFEALAPEVNLLAATLQAWLLGLGAAIHPHLIFPGLFERNTNLVAIKPLGDFNTNALKIILADCLVAAYSFWRFEVEGHRQTREYLLAVIQFFSQVKITVAQATTRRIYIARLFRIGWYGTESILGPAQYERSLGDKGYLADLAPAVRAKFQAGFLASLRRNHDDNLNLYDDYIGLLDPRHFPNIALKRLRYQLFFQENFNFTPPASLPAAHRDQLQLQGFKEAQQADWRYRPQMLQMLELAQHGFEATLIYETLTVYLLDGGHRHTLLEQLLGNSRQLWSLLLQELRQRFGPAYFRQYLASLPSQESVAWARQTVYRPLAQAVQAYLNFLGAQRQCQFRFPESAAPLAWLPLKKLIDYVYNKSVSIHSLDDVAALGRDVAAYIPGTGTSRLQMVEIAVNEGTSKPFIPSVLTELLQNSLDAARARPAPDPRIDIEYCTQGDRFQLSVRDYLGLPLTSLLPLLIPFLSSKSAADLISTGEMGTGFFNVYRQPWSQAVLIRSGRLQILAWPVVEAGRVIDLRYWLETLPDDFVGTKVEVTSAPLTAEQLVTVSLDTHLYVQSVLPALERPITFNDQLYQGRLHLIYISDVGSVKRFEGSSIQESILLTNGVPFGRLESFLSGIFETVTNPLLVTGFVVDINKDYYLPVQSRNRLNLEGRKLEVMKNFLLTGMLWASCCRLAIASDPVFERYLPGGSARTGLDQHGQLGSNSAGYHVISAVSPRWYDVRLFDSYQLYGKALFNFIFNSYVDRRDTPNDALTQNFALYVLAGTTRKVAGQSRSLQADYVGSCVEAVINRWFRNKQAWTDRQVVVNTAIPTISAGVGGGGAGPDTATKLGLALGIFQTFTQAYYATGRPLGFEQLNFGAPAPVVKVGQVVGANAVYVPAQHEIVVRQEVLEPQLDGILRDWPLYIRHLKGGDRARARIFLANSSLQGYLGNTIPSGTLLHELLHSLIGTEHVGAHEPVSFEQGGHDYHKLDFETASQTIYTRLLAGGLVDQLLRGM